MKILPEHIESELDKHCDETTRVYIGCDSQREHVKGQWYANYMVAVVVHINGRHGCKLFGEFSRERDYDKRKNPATRLMNEVYKVVEVYKRLEDILTLYECEVHLDLNPDARWASNRVINQAKGYVLGMTGIEPVVKPNAFAAQYAADWLVRRG